MPSAKRNLEREVKFDAAMGFEVPALGAVTDESTVKLLATYWDTRDLRLLRWGHTLRYRHASDGSEDGWTLKLRTPSGAGPPGAADMLEREEIQADGAADLPPDELRILVVGILRREALVPVATIDTSRHAIILGAGVPGEAGLEVSDDAVSTTIHGEPGPTFRQIEIEMVGAEGGSSEPSLDDLVDRLTRAGAVPNASTKLQKVLDTSIGPEVRVVPVRGSSSTDDVVRFAIASGAVRLIEHDPLVRLGSNPEAVHQARVATRRLRSDLKTLEPLVSRAALERLRDDLGWVGGLLGAVRDLDVLIHRVEDATVRLPRTQEDSAARIVAALREDRRVRHLELVEGMGSVRYINLCAALVEASERPPLADRSSRRAKPVLRRLIRRSWRRTARAIGKLDRQPSDADLHEVRKRAKRARYAAELGQGSFGKPAHRSAKRLEKLQDELGDLQDAVTAEEYLGSLAARRLSGGSAYVSGTIVCQQREVRASVRARWRSAWDAANEKRVRRWLR
jgi:CHAD domain-containing protein